ncbi:MAG: sigma-70 family RNA polymerase sigma factor [Bifidobacteriaceae bacterium]|nr:sigma-70 family RNA polymerase sigma factor [Bifidobacteriaceae bacterium]
MDPSGRSWAQIAESHYHSVYRLAYRLTGNHADAEDLTQDTFVRVFRALDSFQPSGSFEGWLHRITTNLFLDSKRRQALIRVEELGEEAGDLTDPQPQPDSMADRLTDREQLHEALSHLSEDSKVILMMRDVEGCSYQEIADRLGLRLGTVRSRVHRARAQARFALSTP